MNSVKRQSNLQIFRPDVVVFFILVGAHPLKADSTPDRKFVWNDETKAAIAAANPNNGQLIAEDKCDRCHGDNGISAKEDQDIPNLAGQHVVYLLKQNKDFISELRENRGMKRRVIKLSDQELADVSAWYASLLPANTKQPPPTAPDMVVNGFPDRNMPGCAVCHGPNGEGVGPFIPRLAGQKADYLKYALDDFVTGARRNLDPKTIADVKGLTSHEIEAATLYYSGL